MEKAIREKGPLLLAQHQEAFIEMQNNCPLCGGPLEIQIKPSEQAHSLREEATCPSCEVLARIKDHKMH